MEYVIEPIEITQFLGEHKVGPCGIYCPTVACPDYGCYTYQPPCCFNMVT
jgi:hypothetical protein